MKLGDVSIMLWFREIGDFVAVRRCRCFLPLIEENGIHKHCLRYRSRRFWIGQTSTFNETENGLHPPREMYTTFQARNGMQLTKPSDRAIEDCQVGRHFTSCSSRNVGSKVTDTKERGKGKNHGK
jgi:hypothetical protein